MVDRSTLVKASREVFGEQDTVRRRNKILRWSFAGLVFAVFGVAFAAALYSRISVSRPISMPQVKRTPQQTALQTLQLHVDLSPAQSKDMAYRALFRYWDIPYQGNVPPCRQAQVYGLDCLSGQGSLGMLNQLNRPAILKLVDGDGHEYYVTLTAVRGRNADFVVGNENRTVDIKEIEMHWFGDYSLLRETPPNYKGDVRPGTSGPEVLWLDKQLAVIQGRKTRERKAPTYDNVLVRQVKEFQVSKGLKPDGIVGPKTISQLDTEVGSIGPRLHPREVEK